MSVSAPLDPETLARAADLLRSGALVAFPTETVYGLGANALDDHAIARLYAAKGRPTFNPLIIHVATPAHAFALAEVTPAARTLADAFWPGALTLILRRRADCAVSALASAGLETLALRVPAHEAARALIAQAGVPIAAPSANPSGKISATRAHHVAEAFGEEVALVLDGGASRLGLESTIVDATGTKARLLRPGAVALEALQGVIDVETAPPSLAQDDGAMASANTAAPVSSPGQLASHYAPRATLQLDAQHVAPGEALLAFGAPLATDGPVLNLSAQRDLVEAAAHLFAHLHALDALSPAAIAVMPIPSTGLGFAINDRLRRAAAPRPD
ncbi:MAG: L-threonylcarbamoyladenylate synthase [Pseudomonadota bacterium]